MKLTTSEKITFVVGQLGPGGLERQLLYLITELVKANMEVCCIVWNYDKNDFYSKQYERLLEEKVIKLEPNDTFLRKTYQIRQVVEIEQPQVVVSFTTFTNFATYLSTVGNKTVAIGSIRTSFSRLMNQLTITTLINLIFPKRLLINSKRSIDELNSNVFFHVIKKTGFLQNHMDLKQFREDLTIPKKAFSISVGNLTKSKRVDRFVDLFVELKDRGEDVMHYHIGGGQQLERMKVLAKEHGLENSLVFLGAKKDVGNYLNQADVFIHLAEYEGSPNAVVEALASGLPVLTTNCGDVKEYIEEDLSGYVFEDFTVENIADRYVELLHDSQKVKQMSNYSVNSVKRLGLDYLAGSFNSSINKLV